MLLEFPWSIHNWPCATDAGRNALTDIVDTYHVVPVPAYEIDGRLMSPVDYQRHLSKAVVELHFTLTHFTIAEKDGKKGGSDVYTPDLHSMRVLKKPTPTITSPRKRKISTKDPMESQAESSKKKKKAT